MNLIDMIMQAQGGGAVRQISQQFGIGEDQVQSVIGAVMPTLAGAVQQNVQSGGIEGLLGALAGGQHQRYLDDPSALTSPEAVQDGNGILGHLLGSKDVSRQLASHAAEQSGVGSSIIKQMLPVLAGLLMGGIGRQASSGGGLLGQVLGAAMGGGGGASMGGGGGGLSDILGGLLGGGAAAEPAPSRAAAQGGILDMLGPLLDQNRNGSSMDEILGMASRALTQR